MKYHKDRLGSHVRRLHQSEYRTGTEFIEYAKMKALSRFWQNLESERSDKTKYR